MGNSVPEPTKKERRELKREEKSASLAAMRRKRTLGRYGFLIFIALVVGGSGYWLWGLGSRATEITAFDPTKECVSHTGVSRMHIHSSLTIRIDGEQMSIPDNVGVPSAVCLRPLHMHDTTGTIHVESPVLRDYTLGEFFTVWEKPFDRERLLDKTTDAEHRIVMTVDGQTSEEFGNLVLKDNQTIVLSYEKISAD